MSLKKQSRNIYQSKVKNSKKEGKYMENKEQEIVDTATTDVETTTTENEVDKVEENTEQEETPKQFTQEQVNDMVKKRLERDRQSFYKRYGVADKNSLDDLVGKAQSYNVMEERYNAIKEEVDSLKEHNAFLKNNINPERYEDVRAYFKGKEIPFNEENLINEIATHSEWVTKSGDEIVPKTTIQAVGKEQSSKPVEDEKEFAMSLFGLK